MQLSSADFAMLAHTILFSQFSVSRSQAGGFLSSLLTMHLSFSEMPVLNLQSIYPFLPSLPRALLPLDGLQELAGTP